MPGYARDSLLKTDRKIQDLLLEDLTPVKGLKSGFVYIAHLIDHQPAGLVKIGMTSASNPWDRCAAQKAHGRPSLELVDFDYLEICAPLRAEQLVHAILSQSRSRNPSCNECSTTHAGLARECFSAPVEVAAKALEVVQQFMRLRPYGRDLRLRGAWRTACESLQLRHAYDSEEPLERRVVRWTGLLRKVIRQAAEIEQSHRDVFSGHVYSAAAAATRTTTGGMVPRRAPLPQMYLDIVREEAARAYEERAAPVEVEDAEPVPHYAQERPSDVSAGSTVANTDDLGRVTESPGPIDVSAGGADRGTGGHSAGIRVAESPAESPPALARVDEAPPRPSDESNTESPHPDRQPPPRGVDDTNETLVVVGAVSSSGSQLWRQSLTALAITPLILMIVHEVLKAVMALLVAAMPYVRVVVMLELLYFVGSGHVGRVEKMFFKAVR